MIIRWLIGHDSKEIIKTILEISEKLYGLTKSITSDHTVRSLLSIRGLGFSGNLLFPSPIIYIS